MSKLSVVVSAWNEEIKLSRCLQSVKWADEIIIVDSSSTDQTVKIARKFTTKIYTKKNNAMLNLNKNYGFTKATSDWILSLDADEEIPDDLAKEIRAVIDQTDPDVAGYWISRKNIIFGKWIQHGLWWPDRQLRLFRSGRGKFPCKHIHEKIEIEGLAGNLDLPFIHYNYESISQYLRKMDYLYTENEVQKLLAANYQVVWSDALRFPMSDFLKIYFAQEGYKDGLHGLVLSILQSFYSFIVFAKLWEKRHFNEQKIDSQQLLKESKRLRSEFYYWFLTAKLKNTLNPLTRLFLRFRRHYGAKV